MKAAKECLGNSGAALINFSKANPVWGKGQGRRLSGQH